MKYFKHEVVSLVTAQGVTVAAVADTLIAQHPSLSPVWIRRTVKDYLSRCAREGKLARSKAGGETVYTRPLR